jgi:hypothetical protein
VTELRCERCGEAFGCGAGTGSCWCAQVELTDAARAALALSYERCLCPACLAAVAAETVSRPPGQTRARS